MNAHLMDLKKVFEQIKTSEKGLTSAEAQSRIEKYGKNKLVEAKKETILQRFLKQLADPMIIILLVAAAISAVVAVIVALPFETPVTTALLPLGLTVAISESLELQVILFISTSPDTTFEFNVIVSPIAMLVDVP